MNCPSKMSGIVGACFGHTSGSILDDVVNLRGQAVHAEKDDAMMTTGFGDLTRADLLTPEERVQSVVISDPSEPDMPVIFVSEEFETQTGYAPEDVLGRNCRFLQGPGTDPAAVEAIRAALAAEDEISVDILNYRKDGSPFWNRLRIRPIFGDDSAVMFYVGVQNPIDAENVRPSPLDGIEA